MEADIDMDNSFQIVNLQAPANAGEALRQTVNITEADLEQLTDGSDTVLHDHAGISENTTHRTSDGSNHSFLDQSVTSGANVTFGSILLPDDGFIEFQRWTSSNLEVSGIIITDDVDSNSLGVGAILYRNTDGDYDTGDADLAASDSNLVLALESGTGSKKLLMYGFFRNDGWSLTAGQPIYLSNTAGQVTSTPPSGSNDVVRCLGQALGSTSIWFNPSPDYLVLA
jgi:hypothetical protein